MYVCLFFTAWYIVLESWRTEWSIRFLFKDAIDDFGRTHFAEVVETIVLF